MTSPNDIPPWVNDPETPVDHVIKEADHRKTIREKRHTVHGYIHRQTEKAVLFEVIKVNDVPAVPVGSEGKKEWFPISQIDTISDRNGSEHDYIVVTDWIARTKGII